MNSGCCKNIILRSGAKLNEENICIWISFTLNPILLFHRTKKYTEEETKKRKREKKKRDERTNERTRDVVTVAIANLDSRDGSSGYIRGAHRDEAEL